MVICFQLHHKFIFLFVCFEGGSPSHLLCSLSSPWTQNPVTASWMLGLCPPLSHLTRLQLCVKGSHYILLPVQFLQTLEWSIKSPWLKRHCHISLERRCLRLDLPCCGDSRLVTVIGWYRQELCNSTYN